MIKWQCLECGEVWECEETFIFSYCPNCKGWWCKRLGVKNMTAKQYEALNQIAGPGPAYDYAQRKERERIEVKLP